MASQQVMGFKTSYADFQKQGDTAKHKRGEVRPEQPHAMDRAHGHGCGALQPAASSWKPRT